MIENRNYRLQSIAHLAGTLCVEGKIYNLLSRDDFSWILTELREAWGREVDSDAKIIYLKGKIEYQKDAVEK